MVRKITNGEYLKRMDNMTAAERSEYLSRVGDWLSEDGQCLAKKGEVFEARLQNVLQVSVGWNDQECQAFEDGAVLLSALVGVADTKLPELLYAISAKRAIKRMFQTLWEIEEQTMQTHQQKTHQQKTHQQKTHPQPLPVMEGSDYLQPSEPNPAEQTAKRGPGRPRKNEATPDGKTVGRGESPLVPVRPKHFDQYAHLLPQKTQEKIAQYGPLMREFDEAREKLRLLMNDQTAAASDREAWAKKVAKIDKQIGDIQREADREWEKVAQSGRIVVDEFGVARTLPQPLSESEGSGQTQDAEPAAQTQDASEELTSEQRARRRELRKWLTDTRRGNGASRDARVEQWYVNFREYLALEGDKAFEDEKIKEAIGHYGIDVEKIITQG